MGLVIAQQNSPAQQWLVAQSAKHWRTDRVNVFAYGPPGAGKTRLAGTFPRPIFLDSEDGGLTTSAVIADLKLPYDVPVIRMTSINQLIEVARDPEILRRAMTGPFEGYDFQSIAVDTISTFEGWALQEILDNAGKDIPDFPEYKLLANVMRPIFSRLGHTKYNTIFLAHDYDGGIEIVLKSGKTKPPAPPGPLLTGALRKQGAGLADFFIYLRRQTSRGLEPKWRGYWYDHPDGYPARVRAIEPYLPKEGYVENPTYQTFREALDKFALAREA